MDVKDRHGKRRNNNSLNVRLQGGQGYGGVARGHDRLDDVLVHGLGDGGRNEQKREQTGGGGTRGG